MRWMDKAQLLLVPLFFTLFRTFEDTPILYSVLYIVCLT